MFYSPEMASKRSITDNECSRPWRAKNRITHSGKCRRNMCWLCIGCHRRSCSREESSESGRVSGSYWPWGLIVRPEGGDVDKSAGASCIPQRAEIRSGHVQAPAVVSLLRHLRRVSASATPRGRPAKLTVTTKKATSRERVDPVTHGTHLDKY